MQDVHGMNALFRWQSGELPGRRLVRPIPRDENTCFSSIIEPISMNSKVLQLKFTRKIIT